MDITVVLTISFSLVAALFGMLCAIIGWVGSRMADRQDETNNKIDVLKDEVVSKINGLSLRLVKVESRVGLDR